MSESEDFSPEAVERVAELQRTTFVGEIWGFLATNKKWWLTPVIVMILLAGAVVMLGGSAAAPFIYTLF